MAKFTAWGRDGVAWMFGPGTEAPPEHVWDIETDGPSPERIWTVEAETWEEALAKYHEWQGWGPYQAFNPSETEPA